MVHPFEKLHRDQKKRLFVFSTMCSLVLMVVLNVIGAPLLTEAAPMGIISFELAGQTDRMVMILDSWDWQARLHAAFSLGLDYVFMIAYSTAIGLGCVLAARVITSRRWPFASWGSWLAWGQWLAAILDAIENWALTSILFGSELSPWTMIARWCAQIKFLLVFLGLVYSMYGLVVFLMRQWSQEVRT